MGLAVIECAVFTGFWAIVGIIVPCLIPKGPNKGIIQCCLILTSICCWLFWACCYLAQLNPLIGPKLEEEILKILSREWAGNAIAWKEHE